MTEFEGHIDFILFYEPTLTASGLDTGKTFAEDPFTEEEFDICWEWFNEQKETNKLNKKITSYDMKLDVERFAKEKYGRPIFISCGALIGLIVRLEVLYKKIKGSHQVYAAIELTNKTRK